MSWRRYVSVRQGVCCGEGWKSEEGATQDDAYFPLPLG